MIPAAGTPDNCPDRREDGPALGAEARRALEALRPLQQPRWDLLAHAHAMLEKAEGGYANVRRKLLSLTRSFLFHIHVREADPALLARIVNASLQGHALTEPRESREQQRMWAKAEGDARWYAAHLVVMAALGGVSRLLREPVIRATVHPKPGQYAPAPVNVREFNDLPYHRKPVLRAGANPLNLDTYIGANLWSDPHRRFVDVRVGANRWPFLAIQL